MIHQNVELHNVAEVQWVGSGARLSRVPEAVRAQLNETAQYRVRQPDNAEVRFVCDGPARVTLSSEAQTDVAVFLGPFDARVRQTIGPEPTTVEVPAPGNRLSALDRRYWQDLAFGPVVRRLVFGGRRREPVLLHDVAGQRVAPPDRALLPRLRYLAYGTSITQGFDCEGPHLSYVAQTAALLKADLVNLGVGGSCRCERAFADYIAGRRDWDLATLELSVNMTDLPLDEFTARVGYMVRAVAGADVRRPVVCMTLFPFFCDWGIEDAGAVRGGPPDAYRQALRDVVSGCGLPNVHLLEGPALLDDMAGLTADLIHPSDRGMTQIAARLAQRLAAIAGGKPGPS